MEFREIDYQRESNEVVNLIRNNLNPNYSIEILKWKHLDNPFGKSASIVAIDDNKIVGVVFVMQYVFRDRLGEEIKCIRFFDACTDKDQRGKGVFKSLMNLGFELYKNKYDFSFSNPNRASLAGHLRVGFEETADDMYYKIGCFSPFFNSSKGELKKCNLLLKNTEALTKQDIFLSGNNLQFIGWRYQQDNYFVYEYLEEGAFNYIVYRIEKKNKLKAIVICDFYGDNNKINNVLSHVCRKEKTFLLYYLDNLINKNINFLFSLKQKKAVVVLKKGCFKVPDNFVISLGDLEGRL